MAGVYMAFWFLLDFHDSVVLCFFKLLLDHLLSDYPVHEGGRAKFGSTLILELLFWILLYKGKIKNSEAYAKKTVPALKGQSRNSDYCSCMERKMVWKGRRMVKQSFLNFYSYNHLQYRTYHWLPVIFYFKSWNQRNVMATDTQINSREQSHVREQLVIWLKQALD